MISVILDRGRPWEDRCRSKVTDCSHESNLAGPQVDCRALEVPGPHLTCVSPSTWESRDQDDMSGRNKSPYVVGIRKTEHSKNVTMLHGATEDPQSPMMDPISLAWIRNPATPGRLCSIAG